jgi:hypothetical protein
MQATINFRVNDGEMRKFVIMDVSSQDLDGRVVREPANGMG